MTTAPRTTHQRLSALIEDVDHLTVIAGVTIVLSAVLRLFRIGDESIWLDEALSVTYVTSRYSTAELLYELPLSDPHPPLYYLLLDGWIAVFGASEGTIRLLSALFGIGAVLLVYALGTKVVDREAGIVAAALLGLSPFHIYYSQEARMYTLLLFLSVASYYFFVDIVDSADSPDRRTVAMYVAATVLLGYTHVYGFFVILAQNVYVGLRLLMSRYQRPGAGSGWFTLDSGWSTPISFPGWIRIQSAVAALLGPWIGVLFLRVFSISTGSDARFSWIEPPGLVDIPFAVALFLFGGVHQHTGVAVKIGAIGLVAAFAAIGVIVRSVDGELRIGPTPAASLFVVLFLTPLLGAYLVSIIVTPIFVVRYLIIASIGLFLLVGAGVSTVRSIEVRSDLRGTFGRFVPAVGIRHVLIGLLLFALVLHFPAHYTLDQKAEWRESVTMVESSASTGAVVLVTDDYVDAPYQYYADRGDLETVPIDAEAADAQIRTPTQNHDEVWIVHSHAEPGSVVSYFDESDRYEIDDRWEHRYNNIRLYKVVQTREF